MRSNTGKLYRAIHMWWIMFVFWRMLFAVAAGVFLCPDMPLLGQVVGAAIALVIAGWLADVRTWGQRCR